MLNKLKNNQKILSLLYGIIVLLIVILIVIFIMPSSKPKRPGNNDHIYAGWITQSGEYYSFKNDNTWFWYNDYKVLDDNYYSGELEITKGEHAIKDANISYSKVLDIMANQDIPIDNIYYLKMNTNLLISNKIDKTKSNLKEGNIIKMLFVILKDGRAEAFNYSTGNILYFYRK